MTDISSLVNGLFFGYIVTLVLLGITIVQTWIYAHNNNDRWALRIFVTGLALLDIAESVCTTQIVHHYLISHFGDIDVLMSHTNLVCVDFIMTDVIFFMVHLFFTHRLWKLGKRWWFPAIITFTSTTMLALGASFVAQQISGYLVFGDYHQHRIEIELGLFHALAVTTDILITIGLSWTLSPTRASFTNTRMVLQRLLVFTVTRGILVCLVQIGHITMYFLDSKNMMFWVSLHLILTKLYVLTTLVMLNSRRSLRDKLQEVNLDGFHISFVHSARSDGDNGVEAVRCPVDPKNTRVPIASLTVRADGLESPIGVGRI